MELKRSNQRWMPLDRTPLRLELPAYTLLLAERVPEKISEVRRQSTAFPHDEIPSL